MAEEPQPSTIQEGDQASLATPSSAEDRKAAASLSNLDAKADGDTTIRQADTEALGKAMKNLDVRGDTQAGASRKVVKVDAADVNLLVRNPCFLLKRSEGMGGNMKLTNAG